MQELIVHQIIRKIIQFAISQVKVSSTDVFQKIWLPSVIGRKNNNVYILPFEYFHSKFKSTVEQLDQYDWKNFQLWLNTLFLFKSRFSKSMHICSYQTIRLFISMEYDNQYPIHSFGLPWCDPSGTVHWVDINEYIRLLRGVYPSYTLRDLFQRLLEDSFSWLIFGWNLHPDVIKWFQLTNEDIWTCLSLRLLHSWFEDNILFYLPDRLKSPTVFLPVYSPLSNELEQQFQALSSEIKLSNSESLPKEAQILFLYGDTVDPTLLPYQNQFEFDSQYSDYLKNDYLKGAKLAQKRFKDVASPESIALDLFKPGMTSNNTQKPSKKDSLVKRFPQLTDAILLSQTLDDKQLLQAELELNQLDQAKTFVDTTYKDIKTLADLFSRTVSREDLSTFNDAYIEVEITKLNEAVSDLPATNFSAPTLVERQGKFLRYLQDQFASRLKSLEKLSKKFPKSTSSLLNDKQKKKFVDIQTYLKDTNSIIQKSITPYFSLKSRERALDQSDSIFDVSKPAYMMLGLFYELNKQLVTGKSQEVKKTIEKMVNAKYALLDMYEEFKRFGNRATSSSAYVYDYLNKYPVPDKSTLEPLLNQLDEEKIQEALQIISSEDFKKGFKELQQFVQEGRKWDTSSATELIHGQKGSLYLNQKAKSVLDEYAKLRFLDEMVLVEPVLLQPKKDESLQSIQKELDQDWNNWKNFYQENEKIINETSFIEALPAFQEDKGNYIPDQKEIANVDMEESISLEKLANSIDFETLVTNDDYARLVGNILNKENALRIPFGADVSKIRELILSSVSPDITYLESKLTQENLSAKTMSKIYKYFFSDPLYDEKMDEPTGDALNEIRNNFKDQLNQYREKTYRSRNITLAPRSVIEKVKSQLS